MLEGTKAIGSETKSKIVSAAEVSVSSLLIVDNYMLSYNPGCMGKPLVPGCYQENCFINAGLLPGGGKPLIGLLCLVWSILACSATSRKQCNSRR